MSRKVTWKSYGQGQLRLFLRGYDWYLNMGGGQINQALEGKEVEKKVKQKLNDAKKHWPGNIEKSNEEEKKLGYRGSISKTAPGATFVRMKNDHMQNGQ